MGKGLWPLPTLRSLVSSFCAGLFQLLFGFFHEVLVGGGAELGAAGNYFAACIKETQGVLSENVMRCILAHTSN